MTDRESASPDPTMQTPAPGHFFSSYKLCREALLQAAQGFEQSHQFSTIGKTLPDLLGPEDEALSTDWLFFGPTRPQHALIISSGTHGVEGFAGSAIQHQFLAEQLAQTSLEAGTSIILVHANNPYGFAWLRRVTENNVDMNRNFQESFDKSAASSDYELLFDAINPRDLDPENESLRWASLQRFVDEFGMRRFQQAVVEGQYKYPEGVQFGGQQKETCVQNICDMAQEHLADAQTIYWLDIHTGLGEMGACELISTHEPDSAQFKNTKQIWGNSVRSTGTGESLSTPLNGVMDAGIKPFLPADCDLAMVAPEFGTYPMDRVMRAMRADNWLHQHGPKDLLNDPMAREIKAELLEAFRPDRAQWREAILKTGRELISQALDQLPGASTAN